MKQFFAATVFICFVSCAPTYVTYDFDKATDFSNYKTYQYFADMDTGMNELDTKRLLDAMDKKMAAQGFAISETPDFLVDIKTNEFRDPQRETVGVGLGGGGGNVGGGISIGLPIGQPSMTRQISFDFVDAHKNRLFWQAKSESAFSPKDTPLKKEERFTAIVEKVFKKFPPKQK